MTKPILIKKSFNGGELSPELHFRDDLAAYVKGCKHLDNMQATPYGAVTRRPPMELMAKIDTALYGIPVKYIPFKFSLTEVFNIVFTDGSGSESPDSSTADFMVFDDDGDLVILEGTTAELTVIPAVLPAILASGFEALESTPYDPADLNDLHFINVNDYVYLTCGGNYPVQRINRFFDEAANANRWSIGEAPINGLMEDQNLDTAATMTAFAPTYSAAETYSAGDVVSVNTNIAETVVSAEFTFDYSGGLFKRFVLSLTVSDGGTYEVGQTVSLSGMEVTSNPVNCFYGWPPNVAVLQGDNFDGSYQVSSISGDVIEVSARIYTDKDEAETLPIMASGTITPAVPLTPSAFPFYRSNEDGNTGNDPEISSEWTGIDIHLGEVSVNSTLDKFGIGDVGRTISIEVESKLDGDWHDGNSSGTPAGTNPFTSEIVVAQGVYEMITEGGSWGGNLELQESTDGGLTWSELKTISSVNGSSNGSVEVDITDLSTLLRVYLPDYTKVDFGADNKTCLWKLVPKSSASVYMVITEFIDPRNVKAEMITPLLSNDTSYRWAFGVFSGTTGYPFTLTINDERMIYGGCRKSPNTIYASRVNDWANFLEGSSDVSPYTFTVASDSFDTVRSIKSSRQLNIFTDNQEATMGSREDSAVTSVTNIAVSSHTNYGSSHVQAIQMADMIWFAMGQSRRVRASRYDFATDGQQSIEMSLFASHITESGIKEMSFRRHPFNTLFCVLNNGTACTFTYEGAQEVQAWSPFSTAGNIISAYANYSDSGDIVNGIVERNGFYYLEKFGSNDASTVYLDNFVKYVDQDFTLGVPLKQGYTDNLIVVCDDAVLTEGDDYTIIAGVLTIPSATCTTVTVGIPFTSRINPTDVTEHGPNGSLRRLSALALYLLDSGDCEIFINGKESNFTAGSRLADGERLNDRHEITTGGGYDPGCDVNILVTNHKPFTLTGLGYRMTVNP